MTIQFCRLVIAFLLSLTSVTLVVGQALATKQSSGQGSAGDKTPGLSSERR